MERWRDEYHAGWRPGRGRNAVLGDLDHNDNLVEAFIHLVDQYEDAAKRATEEAAQKALTDAGEHLKVAGQVLNLFVDTAILVKASFAQVKAQAFALLEPAQFPVVSNYMRNIEFDRIGFE